MIGQHLNRVLEVWRPSYVPDSSGGQSRIFIRKTDVMAKVDQPSAAEMQVAMQWEAEHTHNVYTLPAADVARGDELRSNGQVFRVFAVVMPSLPRYQKCLCQLVQTEGV